MAASSSSSGEMESLRFLTPELTREVRGLAGTPAYVYDVASLKRNAAAALAFPNAFGLTVRFAMKASPNAAILKLFSGMGLQFDANAKLAEVSFIERTGSAAGLPGDQKIAIKDRLIAVNGVPTETLNAQGAMRILLQAEWPRKLTFLRPEGGHTKIRKQEEDSREPEPAKPPAAQGAGGVGQSADDYKWDDPEAKNKLGRLWTWAKIGTEPVFAGCSSR